MTAKEIIEKLWESSSHGTKREDIAVAYKAGATDAIEKTVKMAVEIVEHCSSFGVLKELEQLTPERILENLK